MLCGLEIHQRLCGRKLFNSCPTPQPDEILDSNSIKFSRKLFPSKSELGKTDVAAKFEKARDLNFEYLAPTSFSCLVDTDEEPPSNISPEALLSVLKFAKSCGCHIIDEVQVMRKLVLDGSNTSGFQRTALIAVGGHINYEGGKIPLETICIEEESAGIVEKNGQISTYRLDRLGVPLIEIATAPVFKSAKDSAAGAQAIGQKLRMLENAMRGLGTIRQDVNVSVEGGKRVEIKGLQDLRMLPTLVENEVKRQDAILEIRQELLLRGFEPQKISPVDLTKVFEKTQCKIISKALESGGIVLGAKLEHYGGLLGREFYSGRRFGSELSDYAKAAGKVKGLIHSDEDMEKYNISKDEFNLVRTHLELKSNDSFILIADKKENTKKAIDFAIERSQILGVVKETRKAGEDGSSSFMRPMAGSSRMYPETDLRPIRITTELISSAGELETIEQRKKILSSLGSDRVGKFILSPDFADLKILISKYSANESASLFEEKIAISREGSDVSRLEREFFAQILELYSKSKITKQAMGAIMRLKCKFATLSASEIASENNLLRLSESQLSKLWESEGGDIKKFMSKYRLIADGAQIMKLAKK